MKLGQLITSFATFVGTLVATPQLAPWARAFGIWVGNLYLRFARLTRHLLVTWFRWTNLAAAIVEIVVANVVVYPLFELHDFEVPWGWYVVYWPMVTAHVVCFALDMTVKTEEGGPDNRNVFRSLRLALGGLLVISWGWGWLGCHLTDLIVLRHPTAGAWAADQTRIIGEVSMFVLVPLTGIWFTLVDLLAALFRSASIVEAAFRSAGITYVAGLDPTKTKDELRQEMAEMFGYDVFAPTTQVINVNIITWLYQMPAVVLVERMAMLVWMRSDLSFLISVIWVCALGGHFVLKAFQKNVLHRFDRPKSWTYLPFVAAVLATGYWVIRGPYRETIFLADGFREAYLGVFHLTHLPLLTGVLVMILWAAFLVTAERGSSYLQLRMQHIDKWLSRTLAAVCLSPFLLIIGGFVYRTAAWDGVVRGVEGSPVFSWGSFWGAGAPFLLILIGLTVLGIKAAKEIADQTVKTLVSWGNGCLVVASIALLVFCGGSGYTRITYAASIPARTLQMGDKPPTIVVLPPGPRYVVQSVSVGTCLPARSSCNNSAQCCTGMICVGSCVYPQIQPQP